jgi:beta-glucosidase
VTDLDSVPAGPVLDVPRFPAGFRWGAATAAYQIEGAADEGGRGVSIWDTFAHTPGKTLHGDNGDIACDHYHRWPADLQLAADLGLTDYRLSVSWARLQPSGRGPLNPQAVTYYRQVLTRLRELGIRPLVTLYHWDLPQVLEDEGGWAARSAAGAFADYARRTIAALGDLAEDWITQNESWCAAFLGYGTGAHAPGRRHLPDAVAAAHHLNLAHGLAVRAIREVADVRVGITHILTDLVPASDDPRDVAATARVDANNNRFFLDPLLRGAYPAEVLDLYREAGLAGVVLDGDLDVISTPIDFLGVNHYQQVVVADDPTDEHLHATQTPAELATTSLGWSIRPQSLRNVLMRASSYTDLPLYVTESGACFEDYVDPTGQVRDTERIDYLHGYLSAVADAIADGADVRGYYAWSLLDNFEWAEGYRKRFGLVYIDYATQTRIPKASAAWYREQIAAHARATVQGRPGPGTAVKTHHHKEMAR